MTDERGPEFEAGVVAAMPGLRRYGLKLTRNSAKADDLVQQTVASALAKHHQFEPGTNLSAWLATIMRNGHFSAARKKSEREDPDGTLAMLLSAAPDQEDSYDLQVVLARMAELVPEQQQALQLCAMQEMSLDEAAIVLGVPVGTVKSRVSRARAELLVKMGRHRRRLDVENEYLPPRTRRVPAPDKRATAMATDQTVADTPTEFRDPGEPPVLDWIDVGLIDIDMAYQRNVDEGRVEKILIWFEWRSFGAIVVAKAADGRFHAVDGQHRLEAARRHPSITHVPAIIVDADGSQAEAEVFVHVNKGRKPLSALDTHWAELAAGDPEAQTVKQTCERAGVTLLRYPGSHGEYRPKQTVAVAAIRSLIGRRHPLGARQVLDLLARSGLAPISGKHISAAELLLFDEEFKDQFDSDDLVETISRTGPAMDDEAKAFAATHRVLASKALASVWFKRARKKRRAAA